jgi:hypothetical protein
MSIRLLPHGTYTDPDTMESMGCLLQVNKLDADYWLIQTDPFEHKFSHGWFSVHKDQVTDVE